MTPLRVARCSPEDKTKEKGATVMVGASQMFSNLLLMTFYGTIKIQAHYELCFAPFLHKTHSSSRSTLKRI